MKPFAGPVKSRCVIQRHIQNLSNFIYDINSVFAVEPSEKGTHINKCMTFFLKTPQVKTVHLLLS